MEYLHFITQDGACGHTEEWCAEALEIDADDWLENFGDRIGTGTAKLPLGGWIDLRKFATITKTR